MDNANAVNFNTEVNLKSVNGQVQPAHTSSSLAIEEFNIEAESMEQAFEDIGLVASKFKKTLSKDNQDEARVTDLEELVATIEGKQGAEMSKLAGELASLGDADAIMSQIGQMNLDTGNVMMLLASIIGSGGLSEEVLKKLRKMLQEMLAEEGSELALIAAMEDLPLDQSGLDSLKNLYQRATHGENGLAKWFSLLKDMPERRKRIKVLLRALSNSLNDNDTSADMVKLISVIDDLRRLLIFMSIEDYCTLLARSCQAEDSSVLTVTLELVEQSWVYAEWLEERINSLSLAEDKKIGFLRRWRDLLLQLPHKCFRDPEQQEHIAESMMDLLDQWCEDE
ncbi:TyeA family type III secretion system gatekeeper subunit [Parashewanella spongiae]|uniref:TyeA family type III secretion system gatekeeper subunit n=1 Tax=Parashewanella spongiae TaxID=342950 RepID=UPI0014045472|nr:TyeA family type III secretion system gatekeeper subunit [Parashewanella spongiae]